MLSDIIPTGLEVGVREGKLESGKTLAVIGAGPVGLAVLIAAKTYNPSSVIVVDLDDNRLRVAKALGATTTINNQDGGAADAIMQLTSGRGVDVVVEAIGSPAGWDVCEGVVAGGGNIAILGVHGAPVTLHLERMWRQNFTMTAGLVHTSTIPMLLSKLEAGSLDPRPLISHRFPLGSALEAYRTFGRAAEFSALKVLLDASAAT